MTRIKGGTYSAKRFRRALRAFVVGRGVQAGATLALALLAVRWLPAEQYAAYMLIWGLLEMAYPLTSLGLLPATQYFLPRLVQGSTAHRVRLFVRGVGAARYALWAVFAVLVAWQWPAVSEWIGLNAAHADLRYVVAGLMVAVLAGRFSASMLEDMLEQGNAQLARALHPVGRLIALLLLWQTGTVTLGNLLWAELAVSLFTLVLAQWFLAGRIRELRDQGDLVVSFDEVLRYVSHMSVAQFLNAAGNPGVLRIVVSKLFGLEATAIFSFLQQLLMIARRYLPSMLLQNLVRPVLVARQVGGDHHTVAVALGFLWKLNVILMLAAIGLVLTGGDALLGVLRGAELRGHAFVMIWLLVGLLFNSQGQVITMGLQLHNMANRLPYVSGLSLAILPFAWVGGMLAGTAGVAGGAAAAGWLRNLLGFYYLQRGERRVALDWPGAIRASLALGVPTVTSMLIPVELHPLALAGIVSGAFLVGLRLARPISAAESELIGRAVPRIADGLARWSRAR